MAVLCCHTAPRHAALCCVALRFASWPLSAARSLPDTGLTLAAYHVCTLPHFLPCSSVYSYVVSQAAAGWTPHPAVEPALLVDVSKTGEIVTCLSGLLPSCAEQACCQAADCKGGCSAASRCTPPLGQH